MLKYTTAEVTFREIPDEITLCINISNCPIHCPDCHSKELWKDIGTELTEEELNRLLKENRGISCVCFMGGDADYSSLQDLVSATLVWAIDNNVPLKVAIYSGRDNLEQLYQFAGKWLDGVDYIKIGPYVSNKGGLDSVNTNQRLYHWGKDITYKFWRHDTNIS